MARLASLVGLLAGMGLVIVSLAVGAPSTPPLARERIRHEDPAVAAVDYDPAEAFGWLLDSARLLSSWRFREGRSRVLRLNLASLPPEIRSLVGDINGLLVKEGSILEVTDGWLRDAARLLIEGRPEDARRVLAQIGGYLQRGEILFDEIRGGIEDLAQRTGVRELPPDARQRQTYEDLLRAEARVRALVLSSKAAIGEPAPAAAFAALLPFVSRLEIADPGQAYPGRRVVIRGQAVEQAPAPSGRRVGLFLDGFPIGDLPLGPFATPLTLPPSLLPGPHIITARLPARGRYLGAEAQRTFTVVRLAPQVRLVVPPYGMAPGRIAVAGSTSSSLGRIKGGYVTARLGRNSQETTTDHAGAFSAGLSLPATLDLVGPTTLTVDVRAREPWHAATTATSRVFIINVVSLGLAALLLTLGGAVLGLRRRATLSPRGEISLSPVAVVATRSKPPLRTAPQSAGMLSRTYVEAVWLIEQATGIMMEPSATMREFLQRSQAILHSPSFKELTLLTERDVYAQNGVGEESMSAVELLDRVKSDVTHGIH